MTVRVALRGAGQHPLDVATLRDLESCAAVELVDGAPDLWLALDGGAQGPSARHGTWALRRMPRAGSMTEVAVVRVHDTDEEVLFSGLIPTRMSDPTAKAEFLASRAGDFVARAATELSLHGQIRGPRRPLTPAATPSRERAGRRWVQAARGQLRAMARQAVWNVGVVPRPIHSFLDDPSLRDVRWLQPPTDFFADPFGAWFDERLVVYGEAVDLADGTGRLAWMHAEGGPLNEVLQAPYHQSYPYILHDGDRRYVIPERRWGREVALYELGDGPGELMRVATLLSGRGAADTTVFRHQDRWWMWFTDLDLAPSFDLHAYWAEELTGPWTPHALVPLKRDMASARCAGTPFVHQGQLYRPAQDCSQGYGGAVVIHRVDELTPTSFRETPVQRIEPDPDGPWPEGVHTLSAAGPVTLVDGKRWTLSRHTVRRELGRLAKRALGRM